MNRKLSTVISALSILVLSLLPATARAQIPRVDAFYGFGDSLADNGNDLLTTKLLHANPAVPPSTSPHSTYFEGRFSDGYVAFEYLWEMLGGGAPGTRDGMRASLLTPILPLTGAVNFAFGGTGTPYIDQTPGGFYAPGLKGQVELFRLGLRGRKLSKNTLFAIVTGANDYRQDAFNEPMPIDQVVGNIADTIRTLYSLGGRDIMVLNLPDIGLTPSNAGNPEATPLSRAHNKALAATLDVLEAQLPKLHLIRADLFTIVDRLPAAMNRTVPALSALFAGDPTVPPGFPMAACLFIDPVLCRDIPGPFNVDRNFLFWDVVHPTTQVHRTIAEYLYSLLQEPSRH
jgi:phospholipase/lecithinase/hemolysin